MNFPLSLQIKMTIFINSSTAEVFCCAFCFEIKFPLILWLFLDFVFLRGIITVAPLIRCFVLYVLSVTCLNGRDCMKAGYVHPARRNLSFVLCLMLCAVGVWSCLTHLTVYLDVEIFELNLLIEDLVVFFGCVLMATGAYRVNRGLSGLGLSVIAVEKIVGICTDLIYSEAQKTPEEICELVFVDMGEVAGVVLSALFIMSELKKLNFIRPFAEKCWFVPMVILLIAFVVYLFTNPGPVTDATAEKFFLMLSSVSMVVWCTDPKGIPRWIAKRIRENENSGIN